MVASASAWRYEDPVVRPGAATVGVGGAGCFFAFAGFALLLFIVGLFDTGTGPAIVPIELLLVVFGIVMLVIADLLLSLGLLQPRSYRYTLTDEGVERVTLRGPLVKRSPGRQERTLLFRIPAPSLHRLVFYPWSEVPVRVEPAWGVTRPDPDRLRLVLALPRSRGGLIFTASASTIRDIACHLEVAGASVTDRATASSR